MDKIINRIKADAGYEGDRPYPKWYPKHQMYNDLRAVVKEVERLEEENKFLLERNMKLSENLERFGQEPEPVFARPGSKEEAKILEGNDA